MREIVKQLFVLFTFMLIGYIVRKKKIVDENAAPMLSNLLIYVFAPAVTLKSLATHLNVYNIQTKSAYVLWAIVLFALVFLGARWLAKQFAKERYDEGVYAYNFTTGNFGYMGYALVYALFGEEMRSNMVLFSVPMTIYIYTEGLRILTNQEKISLKKLCNPALFSIIIGAIIGLTGIKLPGVVTEVLTGAGNCMAPVSMLLTGFVLAEYGLIPMFQQGRVYFAALVRLLLIPAILMLFLRLCNVQQEVILIAVLFYSMPAGLNGVVFPKMMNQDCRTGLSMVMITNLLCLFTIPFMMEILKRII